MKIQVKSHKRGNSVVKSHSRKTTKKSRNENALKNAKGEYYYGKSAKDKLKAARVEERYPKSKNKLMAKITGKGENEQANAWHRETKRITKNEVGAKMHHIDQAFKKTSRRAPLKASWKNIHKKRINKATKDYWE